MAASAASSSTRDIGSAAPPALRATHWEHDVYDRDALPVRVLQFGTGMLLRALVTHAIDAANRAGRHAGRVAVVQSTAHGVGASLAAQDGLFTVLERGTIRGEHIDRATLVGAIGPVLAATTEWPAIEALATSTALRAIVSNVTEAGFHLPATDLERLGRREWPASFPARLALLLAARARRLGNAAPILVVIPTELVEDNGARLAAMVHAALAPLDPSGQLDGWVRAHVRFMSSLVDRITTGDPPASERASIADRLGYEDAVLTVTEPYTLWAIEGDPSLLREVLPVDRPDAVVFAPDIRPLRDRKLRLLNGLHSAMAPIALLAGLHTVRDATQHPVIGAFMRRLLFEELAPLAPIDSAEATAFAHAVLDRFANPWLEHAWQVIAGDQWAKTRYRVVPSLRDAATSDRTIPLLATAIGALLHWTVLHPSPTDEMASMAATFRAGTS
nr:hypothetical protein [Gemmatimonadaceae bacterium]